MGMKERLIRFVLNIDIPIPPPVGSPTRKEWDRKMWWLEPTIILASSLVGVWLAFRFIL